MAGWVPDNEVKLYRDWQSDLRNGEKKRMWEDFKAARDYVFNGGKTFTTDDLLGQSGVETKVHDDGTIAQGGMGLLRKWLLGTMTNIEYTFLIGKWPKDNVHKYPTGSSETGPKYSKWGGVPEDEELLSGMSAKTPISLLVFGGIESDMSTYRWGDHGRANMDIHTLLDKTVGLQPNVPTGEVNDAQSGLIPARRPYPASARDAVEDMSQPDVLRHFENGGPTRLTGDLGVYQIVMALQTTSYSAVRAHPGAYNLFAYHRRHHRSCITDVPNILTGTHLPLYLNFDREPKSKFWNGLRTDGLRPGQLSLAKFVRDEMLRPDGVAIASIVRAIQEQGYQITWQTPSNTMNPNPFHITDTQQPIDAVIPCTHDRLVRDIVDVDVEANEFW